MVAVDSETENEQAGPAGESGPKGPAIEPFLVPLTGSTEVLRSIIEPVVAGVGIELVQLFHVHGSTRDTVRIFIDRKDGTGIAIADLEKVNRLLGDLLDVEDQQRRLFSQRYDLEVGSPGLDRPLTKRSHFKNAVGKKVKVKMREPLENGQRTFTGMLAGADDDGVDLELDGNKQRAPWSAIHSGNVVYEFEPPAKPHPNPNPKHQKHKKHKRK